MYLCKRVDGWRVIDEATGETLFGPYVERSDAQRRMDSKRNWDAEVQSEVADFCEQEIVSKRAG